MFPALDEFLQFQWVFSSFPVSFRRPYISLNGMSLAAQKHRMATEFGWIRVFFFVGVVEVLYLVTWGTRFVGTLCGKCSVNVCKDNTFTGWWFRIFLCSPRKLGKISNLTNIFQMG